jgi:menaquinone-dependent protoporphyrinogen oxidase
MTTVLVVYATRNGSTQQVAEAIAVTLRDQGARAECRPARGVRDAVHDVDLVVLGAPLYNGRWHRVAHRFLERHRHRLPPIAVFGMGPRTDEAEAWLRSRAQLDRALAKHPWLAATSVALFGGVDPPGKAAGRDLRDWAAISAWATQLTGRVPRPASPPAS